VKSLGTAVRVKRSHYQGLRTRICRWALREKQAIHDLSAAAAGGGTSPSGRYRKYDLALDVLLLEHLLRGGGILEGIGAFDVRPDLPLIDQATNR
jgi:hypothetical protein